MAIHARLDAAPQQAQARTGYFKGPPIKRPPMELGADPEHNALHTAARPKPTVVNRASLGRLR